MKTILVYDVAAEHGGALSVLDMVYEYALKDHEFKWIFILSKIKRLETENISVENFLFPKKSWFHRLYFDRFKTKSIIKKYNPDVILNLQNVMIPVKTKQILYVHQCLPFVEYRVNILDFKTWIYQNIIGIKIIRSCRKCDLVIIQNNWIKASLLKYGIKEEKILIKKLMTDVEIKNQPHKRYLTKNFFYPASCLKYKNHFVILEACKILKEQNINYKIYFTFGKADNKLAEKISKFIDKNQLNVALLGYLSKDEVKNYYETSNLLFASFIESFGLPLVEAQEYGNPILACKTNFAIENCKNYYDVKYFAYNNTHELAALMKKTIEGKN